MLADVLSFTPTDYQTVRRYAFKFCYQQEINQEHAFTQTTLENFMKHFHVEKEHKEFLTKLLNAIFARMAQCDALVEKHAKNWKLYRIAKVDLSILRVAITELIERETTSPAIIISDALNIAQEYGSENSASFLNGILDAVSKEIREIKK